jgi:alanine dehydrogenase
MHYFDAENITRLLPYGELIDALEEAFGQQWTTPERAQHQVVVPDGAPGTLLMMPAWQPGTALGIKVGTVFPGNAKQNLPAVYASYILLDASSGQPIALMDGTEITLRRTASASALASRYLSREDSRRLLMVGTGKLAPHMIAAHAIARNITEVSIWGRRKEAVQDVLRQLAKFEPDARPAGDLESAVRQADIICCATLSAETLIRNEWLTAGQHLDLVGAFTPGMRETDVQTIANSAVFVDTYAGALGEAGDILQAIEAGVFTEADIQADLAALVQGQHPGRTSGEQRTLFKSVGTAIEDLAAAQLAMRKYRGEFP